MHSWLIYLIIIKLNHHNIKIVIIQIKNDQRNTCTKVTSVEIMIRHTIASSNYCNIVVLCSLINYVLWSSASPLNGMNRATYAKARPASPLKLIGFSFCIPFLWSHLAFLLHDYYVVPFGLSDALPRQHDEIPCFLHVNFPKSLSI